MFDCRIQSLSSISLPSRFLFCPFLFYLFYRIGRDPNDRSSTLRLIRLDVIRLDRVHETALSPQNH